jgi:N-acetylmuramoyl-L-alanine amidase
LEIKKINFTWRQPLIPLNLSRVDSIAYHHMAHPTADIREVERWHLANDGGTWRGFGYNYWISKNGEIYEGRGLNVGAGVAGENGHIISIGFQGDYEKVDREMPVLQYNAGVWLTKKLMKDIPIIKVIHGHKYWNKTACPGKYFPLAEMVTDVFRKEPEHWADGAYTFLTKEKGITVHEKRFDDAATRGDMFVMLARVLGYRG